MNYIDSLRSESESIQNKIELILEKYKIQPIGNGYIDLITSNSDIEDFISELSGIKIIINGVTWWCHCTEKSKKESGCPHGMGGPRNRYGDGWFSEMQVRMFEIPDEELIIETIDILDNKVKVINEKVIRYIKHDFSRLIKYDFSKEKAYLECLVPALWLYVPDEWKRLWYFNG